MKVRKGTIVRVGGSWGSGLAELVIDEKVVGDIGGRVAIYCDNAPTVRALESAFGGVIGAGHTVNPKGGHVGQEIYYSTDAIGILEAFMPVDDAPPEMVRIYEEEIP